MLLESACLTRAWPPLTLRIPAHILSANALIVQAVLRILEGLGGEKLLHTPPEAAERHPAVNSLREINN